MKSAFARLHLRNLPLATRLVLAIFLLTVGTGYLSALVQIHFQHATAGSLLPDSNGLVDTYHGTEGKAQIESLLTADESKPFNGTGTMRQTFTTKSAGWKAAIRKRAGDKRISMANAEAELRRERDGERLAVLDWVRSGASQEAFDTDSHPLSASLAKAPITADFVDGEGNGDRRAKIKSIFESRCARCHTEGKTGSASQIPLETWADIHDYCRPDPGSSGTSVKKLAQTTHAHLLSFAMLFGLTGLIASFTSYPGWARCLIAPLPLLAQVTEVGFWWLARADAVFAKAILVVGALVAMSLMAQILLSLFNMFGRAGKAVLAIVLVSALLGGYVLKQKVIDPYLAAEKAGSVSSE